MTDSKTLDSSRSQSHSPNLHQILTIRLIVHIRRYITALHNFSSVNHKSFPVHLRHGTKLQHLCLLNFKMSFWKNRQFALYTICWHYDAEAQTPWTYLSSSIFLKVLQRSRTGCLKWLARNLHSSMKHSMGEYGDNNIRMKQLAARHI